MSSWSCPHLDETHDFCRRLMVSCVPGRKGCVLPKNLKFAVPPEQRVDAIDRAAEHRVSASSHKRLSE